jgi:hypothetical protein
MNLFDEDEQKVRLTGRAAANGLRVLSALRQRPALTIKHLCDSQCMTFPTASKSMQALVSVGIAYELTGLRRNRVFVYKDYLGILNEGGEPL